MFSSPARAGLVALLALVALGGLLSCSQKVRRPVERLAIPPFENLSDDPALNWIGWGVREAVAGQIEGSARIHPLRLSNAREAALAGATSVLRGYFTVSGGRIRLRVSQEKASLNRVTATFEEEAPLPAGIFRLANSLARQIEPGAHAFDTASVEALKALAEGQLSNDPTAASAGFARSVAADPDFGTAYVAWAQLLLSRGDRIGAQQVLERTRGRGDRIAAPRKAQMDLLAAWLADDRAARRRALAALSRMEPADSQLLGELGREETIAHNYNAASEYYRRATVLDPLDTSAWNQLGYAEALRKDLPAARSALLEYQRLSPQGANPLDSLGDVHFYLGAFADAEKFYLQAYAKDSAFLNAADLYKAARARLMTGDIGGADEIFRRYIDARRTAQDPLAGYRYAQWRYLTGRRAEGAVLMKQFAAGSHSSLAETQLAVWNLVAGNTATVEKLPRAYGLLLTKRFEAAVPVLNDLAAQTDPLGPGQTNVLLAWALIETGRTSQAVPWLETYGVPQPGVEDPFACLSFPREFLLRAIALEDQGHQRQAAQMREIYRKLSGG